MGRATFAEQDGENVSCKKLDWKHALAQAPNILN